MRAGEKIILCLLKTMEAGTNRVGLHFGNALPYRFLPPDYRSPDGEEVVIVRGASGALLARAAVQTKVGAGEAVVVVPKKSIFRCL